MRSTLVLMVVFSLIAAILLASATVILVQLALSVEAGKIFTAERSIEVALVLLVFLAVGVIILTTFIYHYGYQIGQSDYFLGEIRYQNYKGNVVRLKEK